MADTQAKTLPCRLLFMACHLEGRMENNPVLHAGDVSGHATKARQHGDSNVQHAVCAAL